MCDVTLMKDGGGDAGTGGGADGGRVAGRCGVVETALLSDGGWKSVGVVIYDFVPKLPKRFFPHWRVRSTVMERSRGCRAMMLLCWMQDETRVSLTVPMRAVRRSGQRATLEPSQGVLTQRLVIAGGMGAATTYAVVSVLELAPRTPK